MNRPQADIVISGGGVAGLTAAACMGAAGFSVLCVEPHAPITQGSDPEADLRTTAVLQPARDLMDQAGIWAGLQGDAMPLQVMRIVDASGDTPVARDFDAADISDDPFGWNLRNWMLRRALVARLDALPNVELRIGVGFKSMLPRQDTVIITLTDQSQVEARLLIGADGRNSPVRLALGIGAKTTRHGQKALTFAVTHAPPHGNVSTEIHRDGGPFTLVPLPDHDGHPCSAVVWMTDGATAEGLAALDTGAFNTQATERSAGLYGPLTLVTRRQVWPIISQLADTFTGPRTALMAEAAHVMPPIGAQGLNMSLSDLASLRNLATADPSMLGSRSMLDSYQRHRRMDAQMRIAGVNLLNRTSQSDLPLLQTLRRGGMQLLHDTPVIRRNLMKLGLGAG